MKKKKILLIAIPLCLLTLFLLFYSKGDENIYTTTSQTVDRKLEKESERVTPNLMTQIHDYLDENEISYEAIAIVIYNTKTSSMYKLNANTYMTSASLYKLPLAMLYYEAIEKGTYALSDTLLYTSDCYEEGGPVGNTYQVGDTINIEELLYDSIVYSDNTASHILFENLGGWSTFKTLASKYSDNLYEDSFYVDNVFPASFGNAVLSYLYEHADTFGILLEHLQLVYPDDYLSRDLDVNIAQKYGSYNTSENAMGIVYGNIPYLITVLTELGNDGIKVMSDINVIAYNFFNDE